MIHQLQLDEEHSNYYAVAHHHVEPQRPGNQMGSP